MSTNIIPVAIYAFDYPNDLQLQQRVPQASPEFQGDLFQYDNAPANGAAEQILNIEKIF